MSRRNKIIIAVLVILFFLGILLMVLLSPRSTTPQSPQDKNIPEDLQPSGSTGNLSTSTTVPVARPPLADRVAPPVEEVEPAPPPPSANVQRLAVAFAERFGSFSNQGDYQNIIDLKAFMSAGMSAWADTYVRDARAAQDPAQEEYFGVTTRSISTTLDVFDESAGKATVTVFTQRNQSQGLSNTGEVYYQSIVITFVKQGDQWKVDSALWQERT